MNSSRTASVHPVGSLKAWYVTSLLMVTYFIAYIDRSVVNLLIEDMKRDLILTDAEVSLIVGPSFGLFFAIAGFPLGWLSDNRSRKKVVIGSIAAWSVMIALAGLAKDFRALFLSRVGVGIGEAGLNPSATSMIADLFPSDRRQMPLTCYFASGMVGAGLSALIGAELLGLGRVLEGLALPYPLADIWSWQWVFIILAGVGVPLCLLFLLTVGEPVRQQTPEEVKAGYGGSVTFREAMGFFRDRWRCFVPLIVAPTTLLMVMIGYLVWGIPYVMRTYGFATNEAALYYATPVFLSGVVGNVIGGAFGQALMKRGYIDGLYRAMLIVTCVCAIPLSVAPLISPYWLFISILVPFVGLMGAIVTLPQLALQAIVPNRLRGQSVALFYMALNIIGYSLGPMLVAILTDYVFRDERAVGLSLATLSTILFPVAAVILWKGMPYYRQQLVAINGSRNFRK